ncbi:preQ(1) synthase [Pontibacter sp. SGAir0037]|uniref:preQ(1) synthase n=1 Tax=Pontibacter sp. SGAir0037 TaxID=2571030 RepID=UPI0010CD4A68|nr:preQ(1) synthase [Pontibacter sp. SGAir0037]QCR24687.1 preQ(1) synthase [Pontibacter sp. SGAir0037]
MNSTEQIDIKEQLKDSYRQALEHTSSALDYMAEYGIKPDGKFGLFFAPSTRQQEIHIMPYKHTAKQVVVYETETGEFSALCPFSGLPDFGTLRVEYIPGSHILELKSLKYYILSWRNIGSAQEDITAYIYEDLKKALKDPAYLIVTTVYNVRGGINTTCSVDSRAQ